MLGALLNPISTLHRKSVQPWLRRAQLAPFHSLDLPPRSQQALSVEVAELGSHQLETIWLDYLANGGNATLAEFHRYLQGNLEMPHFERRALEHTLWELRHFPVNPDTAPDCCDRASASVPSINRFTSAPSPDLLAALVGRSTPWHPLAGTAVGGAAAHLARAGREQLDRLGSRPHWRHRRYVGW